MRSFDIHQDLHPFDIKNVLVEKAFDKYKRDSVSRRSRYLFDEISYFVREKDFISTDEIMKLYLSVNVDGRKEYLKKLLAFLEQVRKNV